MAVSIESFLVLEKSLSSRIHNSWRRDKAGVTRKIVELVQIGEFAEAVDLCAGLSLGTAAKNNQKFAEFVGLQAMLFGASRLTGGDPRRTSIASRPEEVEQAAENLVKMLDFNATEAVCRTAIDMLNRERTDQQEETFKVAKDATQGFVTAFVSNVDRNGNSFIDIGSSLHTSRLASWGFIVESEARGFSNYQVNEQLDNRTCPICREMHGKTFTVEHAKVKLEQWLNTTNPNDLKSIAPWPKQDKKSVAEFKQLTPAELAQKGWDTPPFHPLCRGILVEAGTVTEIVEIGREPVKLQPTGTLNELLNPDVPVEVLGESIEKYLAGQKNLVTGDALARLNIVESEFAALKAAGNVTRGELEELVLKAGLNRNGGIAFGDNTRRLSAYGEGKDAVKAMHTDLVNEGRAAWSKFEQDSVDGIRRYMNDGYRFINPALRKQVHPSSDTQKLMFHMKKTVWRWPVMEHDTVVFRAGKLPMRRTADINDLVGARFTDKGYVSTSVSEDIAKGFGQRQQGTNVLYEIRIPKGSQGRALALRDNVGEAEVLLAPGTRVEVVKAEMVEWVSGEEILKLTVEVTNGNKRPINF